VNYHFLGGGIINPGDTPVIGSDSYIPRQSSDAIVWNEVTQVSGASCQANLFNNSTHVIIEGTKEVPAIGKMTTRYIKAVGSGLKTELEVTNLSALTDRYFATTQIMQVPRFINFGGVQRDLANFNGSVFDRTFIIDNKAEVTQLADRIQFNLGLGFKHLTDITIRWDGSIATMEMDYSFNPKIILPGQTFIVDPTVEFTGPTVLRNYDQNNSGVNCGVQTFSGVVERLFLLDANTFNNSCYVPTWEFDISSIENYNTVISASMEFDVDLDDGVDENVAVRHLITQPAIGTVTWNEGMNGKGIVDIFSGFSVGNDQSFTINATGLNFIQNRISYF